MTAPASSEQLAEPTRLVPPPLEHDPAAPLPDPNGDPHAFLGYHFARAWPLIEAVLAAEPIAAYTRETLWGALVDGSVLLLPGLMSVRLATVVTLPAGGSALNIWLSVGDPDDFARSEHIVTTYCRERGIDGILVQARPDQCEAFPDYATRGVVLYKDLRRWAD